MTALANVKFNSIIQILNSAAFQANAMQAIISVASESNSIITQIVKLRELLPSAYRQLQGLVSPDCHVQLKEQVRPLLDSIMDQLVLARSISEHSQWHGAYHQDTSNDLIGFCEECIRLIDSCGS